MIIETRNLSYRFGNQLVLDQVSLNVGEGSVYGFLGPNGAGKTTTIKVLLNLLQTGEEKVFLFGKDLNKNRVEILSGIGSLIEQPAIYSHLSGRENLLNRALLLQVHSVKVHEMLDLVNLTEHADKKAGQYSLGMKQRLGIALALLHDPKLLILDEPTNGLDPNGIIEIRQLIRKLVQERAKTVFISSHLLTEVEKMVTHIGIINRGKLLFQGTIEELHNVSKKNLEIQTNDLVRSRELLCKNGYQAEILSDLILIPYLSENQSAEINSLLVKHDHRVYSLTMSKQNLEN
ncbi:MAG: ABC transporter ATP-binding protein, partial [Sphingobacteriales bacterium 24-40-4]